MSIDFISCTNKVEFDSIDFNNNLIATYIDDQYVVHKWIGDVVFFNDTDDLFGNVVGYNHTLNINIVYELSDPNLVLLNYKDDDIVEHIVQAIHDDFC